MAVLGNIRLPEPIPARAESPIPSDFLAGIPRGKPVPATHYPQVDTRSNIRFEVHNGLEWVEFTHLVDSAEWTIGEQQPNRVGSVMRPAQGAITILDNGEFSVLNTNQTYNPHPGARVRIMQDNELIFNGYSAGVQVGEAEQADQYISTMPIYSSMRRLAEFDEGFFQRLTGTPYIHEAIQTIIGNHKEQIPTQLDRSKVQIYSARLNRSGALGSNRQQAQFLDALRTLAVLEGGRIYDNRTGVIRFENFERRLRFQGTPKKADRHYLLTTNPQETLVVNVIQGSSQAVASSGVAPIEFTTPLPIEIDVPPGEQAFGVELYVADEQIQFVESWDSIDVEYGGEVRTEQFDTFIRIIFSNPTNRVLRAKINEVRGEAFRLRLAERFYARSEPSISIYGPKAAIFPSEMIVDQGEMRARMSAFLHLYDGINREGGVNPIISLKMNIRDPQQVYDISDLVLVDWITPLKQHARDYPFWVDATRYIYQNDSEMIVELTLTDALRPPIPREERLLGNIPTVDPNAPVEVTLGEIGIIPEHEIGKIGIQNLLGTIDIAGGERPIGHIPLESPLGAIAIAPADGHVLGKIDVPPHIVFEREIGRIDIDPFDPKEVKLGDIYLIVDVIPPPDNLQVRSFGQNFIIWDWDSPAGIIEQYEWQLREGNNPWSVPARTTATALDFRTLQSDTEYTVRIRSVVGTGPATRFSDWIESTARTAGLTPPRNLSVLTENVRDITLDWDPPEAQPTEPLYRVQFRVLETVPWLTFSAGTPNTGIRIEGLRPSTNYEFRVRAEYSGGNSIWVLTNGRTDDPTTPAPPSLGNARITKTTYSILVDWDAVPDVHAYDVRFTNKTTSGSAERTSGIQRVSNSEYLIRGLPVTGIDATYELEVRSVIISGNTEVVSDWRTLTGLTRQERYPARIAVHQLDIARRNITWTWRAPVITDGTENPNRYLVQIKILESQALIVNTELDALSYTFENATLGVQYEITVVAVYIGGRSTAVAHNAALSAGDVEKVQFRPTPVSGLDWIQIGWFKAGNADAYDVEVKEAGLSYSVTSENTQFGGLSPDTEYTVQVRGKNAEKVGVWSVLTPKPRTKAVLAPSTPRVVDKEIDSITWIWTNNNSVPPSSFTGYGFEYFYRKIGESPGPPSEVKKTYDRIVVIEGLEANTQYEISVRAVYKDVHRSVWVTNRANTNDYSRDVYIARLHVNEFNNTSVHLRWEIYPQIGAFAQYQFKKASDSVWSDIVDLPFGRNQVVIDNLSANTLYDFRVRGTGAGYGTSVWFTISQKTATSGEAQPPMRLSPIGRTQDSLTFGWEASLTPGATYEYQFRVLETAVWSGIVPVSGRTALLSGLAPNTHYEIRVRAVSNAFTPSGWVVANNQTLEPVITTAADPPTNVRASQQPLNRGRPVLRFDWDRSDTSGATYEYRYNQLESTSLSRIQETAGTRAEFSGRFGEIYEFWVRAIRGGLDPSEWVIGAGTMADEIPEPDPPLPDVIQAPSLTCSNVTQVTIALNLRESIPTRFTGFQWQWRRTGETTWSKLRFTDNRTIWHFGLTPDTWYDFRARSVHGGRESEWAETSCKTLGPPVTPRPIPYPIPRNVRSEQNSPSEIVFLWDPPSDTTYLSNFTWQFRRSGSTSWESSETTDDNTVIITNLPSGTTYQFRVRANYAGFEVIGGSSGWVTISGTTG